MPEQKVDPTTPHDVHKLLKRFQIRPDRGLGQNFLIHRRSLDKVIRAANLVGEEKVLEVGAGLGSLTRLLSKHAREVLAIEFDKRLIPALEHALETCQNVRIIQADILKLDLIELMGDSHYCVVANIPYYLSSALIRKLLECAQPADRIVLTLQREVAERALAPTGKSGLLTLSVKMYGEARIAGSIPAEAFYPPPKVESAILAIDVYSAPKVSPELIEPVFSLAKAGFSQRRKQLRNSLSSGMGHKPQWAEDLLHAAGVDPKKRAQELRLEDWVALAGEFQREAGLR